MDNEYIIIGNQQFMISYLLDSETRNLTFEYNPGEGDLILVDNENNKWNIFGEAIQGPRKGQKLENASSFMNFWFAIPTFYNTKIYEPL